MESEREGRSEFGTLFIMIKRVDNYLAQETQEELEKRLMRCQKPRFEDRFCAIASNALRNCVKTHFRSSIWIVGFYYN